MHNHSKCIIIRGIQEFHGQLLKNFLFSSHYAMFLRRSQPAAEMKEGRSIKGIYQKSDSQIYTSLNN